MNRIVNLTGKTLRLTDGKNIVVVQSQGRAKVVSLSKHVDDIVVEGLDEPLHVTELREQEIIGLPPPRNGVLIVVSGIVAAHAWEREDVVAPGRILRDSKNSNRIVGCQSFVKPLPPEHLQPTAA